MSSPDMTRAGGVLTAAVLVCLLGWLILRTVAIGHAGYGNLQLLEQIVPEHPALIPDQRTITAVDRERNNDRLRAATRFSPLSADPASDIAALASVDGAHAHALRLLANARVRDPRNAVIRLQLVGTYLMAGRPDLAIDEADTAMRLNPRFLRSLAPLLPAMASTPAAAKVLRRSVRSAPPWTRLLLRTRQLYRTSPALLFTIINEMSTGDIDRSQLLQQEAFLDQFVSRDDVDTAFLAFMNFLPKDANPRAALVYDGQFAGLPGPPPFNWDLVHGQIDRAQINGGGDGSGGLRARFFTDRSVTLASQLILLPAGTYRLVTSAASTSELPSNIAQWTVRCLSGRNRSVLGKLPLEGLSDRSVLLGTTFSVPEGCRAQRLALSTRRSDAPDEQHVDVASVAIERSQ